MAMSGVWTVVLVYMIVGEWHGLRYLSPSTTPIGVGSIRVVFWNPETSSAAGFTEAVLGQRPDLLLVANAARNAD